MLEDKTCIPISFMETNHHLYYKCHWGSFVTTCITSVIGDHLCVLCTRTCCRQKTLLPFVFRKNFIKSVLMKLSYLMFVSGKRKHAYLFPLWRPITTSITCVIGDHLCVLCSRTCCRQKNPFAFRF